MLHGLGDSGHGWSDLGNQLSRLHPHVKWIFPSAASIPITVNGGMKMPGWYDIVSLDKIQAKQDKNGMLASSVEIGNLIKEQTNFGIQPSRVVLAGFSQGGAMSLLTGLTFNSKLAGIVCLSGYLPLGEEIDSLR